MFALIIKWFLMIELIGLAALPLTLWIFRRIRGSAFFAKPFGLLVSSYVTWLLCSLGILNYSTFAIIIGLFSLLVGSCALLYFRQKQVFRLLRKNLVPILISELVFVIGFSAILFLRVHDPNIQDFEKQADFAFINGIIQSESFPPSDPWCAGETINYYYYGHYLMANLIKFSNTLPEFGYNLCLAILGGLVATGAFGLGFSLSKKYWGGALALFCLMFMGNFYSGDISYYGKPHFFENLKSWSNAPPDFFWHPSRDLIPRSIHEFPYFSFLIGDLHAHLIAIPFALMTLAVLLALAKSPYPHRIFLRANLPLLISAAFLIGLYPLLNMWDLPSFIILFIMALLCAALNILKNNLCPKEILSLCGIFLGTAAAAVLLYLPFHFSFVQQPHPLKLVSLEYRSTFLGFFAINGFFLIALLMYHVGKIIEFTAHWLKNFFNWTILFPAGSFLFGYILYFITDSLVISTTSTSAALCLVYFFTTPMRGEAIFTNTLAFLASAIFWGCEVIYVSDIYNSRVNSIFKFYYFAWIILSIATPFFIMKFCSPVKIQKHIVSAPIPKNMRIPLSVVGALLTVAILIPGGFYVIYGTETKIPSIFGEYHNKESMLSKPPIREHTLDGFQSMKKFNRPQYDAIQWLRQHSQSGDVILEASGGSYNMPSASAVFSAASGIPTVLGWHIHEELWRACANTEPLRRRVNDIDEIYNSSDKKNIIPLLERYKIKYIIVGPNERDFQAGPDRGSRLRRYTHVYLPASLTKSAFAPIAQPVFDASGICIYEVLPEILRLY